MSKGAHVCVYLDTGLRAYTVIKGKNSGKNH